MQQDFGDETRVHMIIEKIRRSDTAPASHVECEIRAETGEGGTTRIFASTEPPYTLQPDPNAFLLGAFLPAWMAGERRIRVEAPICPLLAANLIIAGSIFRTWYPDLPAAPVIEGDFEYRPPATKAAAFLSGGVDSLAMLRDLTRLRPAGHPDRPSAAVVVDYPHMGGISREETDARFARSVATSREICAGLGLDVIPVSSNFCLLNGNMRFWMYRYHGAFLASMGHFLGHEFRLFSIASSRPATNLAPWGSHAQLDPFYSSHHVRISHEGVELSRLGKVEVLRDWPAALDRLYVCTSNTSNGVNCGICEKCVRTRLHLLVAGSLQASGAFAGGDVSEAEVRAVRIRSDYACVAYEEALPHLRRLGRDDLAAAVEVVVGNYYQSQARVPPPRRSLARRVAGKVTRLLTR
jgi:hypothetical protein